MGAEVSLEFKKNSFSRFFFGNIYLEGCYLARKLPEVEYYNAVHFHVQVVGLRAAIL